ncbi:MAG: HPr family phosphocarrier protein [Ruminococcus sp.]|nr:HPr family phosphocarrier protein [Ruminococcus sp.]
MYYSTVAIHNIATARQFVAMTAKYPKIKIMLNCREYSVDAHSIIGILSLDLTQPIKLEAEGENIDALIADLKPYTV